MEVEIGIFLTDKAMSDFCEVFFLMVEIQEEKAFSMMQTMYLKTNQLGSFPKSGCIELCFRLQEFSNKRT